MRFRIYGEMRAVVRDKRGRIINIYPWRKTHSLLKQFIQLLTVQFSQANQTITLVDGTSFSMAPLAGNFQANGPSGNTLYGIVIGTGTTPVTMTDNKLEAQATTNIAHAAPSFAVENPTSSAWRIVISRGFTNNTGATLSVREVAIYTYTGSTGKYICNERSLYSVAVPAGATLTMTWRLTATL